MGPLTKPIGMSLGVHALLLGALLLLFASPKPYASVPEEAITVDVVSAEDVPQKTEPELKPTIPTEPEKKQETLLQPAAAQQQPAPAPQQQAAVKPEQPVQPKQPQQATPQPTPSTQPQAQQTPPQTQSQQQAPEAPQAPRENRFDVTAALLYYGTNVPNSDFDTRATDQANLSRDDISAFKQRLKACWRPGPEIKSASKTHVVLRITLRQDGGLAREPELIEAAGAADGPAVMMAAKAAVSGCAPFGFLPRDRYSEWRLMDVRFTPQDMAGG